MLPRVTSPVLRRACSKAVRLEWLRIADETTRAAVPVVSFQAGNPANRKLDMSAVAVRQIGKSQSGDPKISTKALPAIHPRMVLMTRDKKLGCACQPPDP